MEYAELERLLLAMLDSVLPPRSCAYVAGPLESGKNYYDSLAVGTDEPSVRSANQVRLRAVVQRLRGVLAYPVFDPGVLKVSGWSDADHGVFFIQIIERYVKEVWLLDGWEFSRGATKEFVHCVKLGIPCRTEAGNEISPEDGLLLIQRAAEYVERLGLDASKLRSRLS